VSSAGSESAGGGGRTGAGSPTCLRAGAASEMWVGKCTTRDGRQQRGRLDRGLASGHRGASTSVSHIPPMQYGLNAASRKEAP
jgi:hypothetical protein